MRMLTIIAALAATTASAQEADRRAICQEALTTIVEVSQGVQAILEKVGNQQMMADMLLERSPDDKGAQLHKGITDAETEQLGEAVNQVAATLGERLALTMTMCGIEQ